MMPYLDDGEYDPNWCPDCGLPYGVCNCDWEDYRPADYDIGEYRGDEDERGDECAFPGECLMPGEHLRSECHNVEMAEAWAEEAAQNS